MKKVLLVTSSYHMPRAVAIAHIMLGAAWRPPSAREPVEAVGIDFEAYPVESSRALEPRWKIWRDSLRAWIWRLTGWDFRWLLKKVMPWVRRPEPSHFLQ